MDNEDQGEIVKPFTWYKPEFPEVGPARVSLVSDDVIDQPMSEVHTDNPGTSPHDQTERL